MTSFLKGLWPMLPALGCMLLCLSGCAPVEAVAAETAGEETKTIFAMDTYFTLTVYGGRAAEALDAAEAEIRKMERLWSVVDSGSELYALNHSGGVPMTVSSDTAELLAYALRMAQETGGAFDPTIYPMLTAWGFTTGEYHIPEQAEIVRILQLVDYEKVSLKEQSVTLPEGMQLDFGGIAKGAAGSRLARLLKEEYGIRSALLNLGGNVQAIGRKADGTPWRIGIRSPYGESMLGVIEMIDEAVITSGGYERYFTGEDGTVYWHIIDPRTGRPANSGLSSVTVVGSQGEVCDALSTALFVMGLEDAAEYWRDHSGFELLLVTEKREIYLTSGLADRFSASEGNEFPIHVLERDPEK